MKKLRFFSVFIAAALTCCACGTSAKAPAGVNDDGEKEGVEEMSNVGYGSVAKDRDATESKKIKTEDIPQKGYTSVAEFLQGRAPGVQVTDNGSGEPTIIIRGVATINGNTQPLYILDGVEISSLMSLNPNDIYSVEVLSGVSASIYGSRGGNGVLIFVSKGKHEADLMLQEQERQERLARKAARKAK